MAVIAFNDAWVMSAWGKANGIKGDDIVCLLHLHNLDSQVHSVGGGVGLEDLGRYFANSCGNI